MSQGPRAVTAGEGAKKPELGWLDLSLHSTLWMRECAYEAQSLRNCKPRVPNQCVHSGSGLETWSLWDQVPQTQADIAV